MAKKKVILDPIECAVCGATFVPADKRRRACSRSCGGKLGNTEEARKKAKKTRLELYGDENFNNREKVRKTIQAKYGEQYINTSQVPEIKAKIIDSYTKNNGGMGMASKSVAKKVLNATKEKLGIEDDTITNVGQIEAIKDKIRRYDKEEWKSQSIDTSNFKSKKEVSNNLKLFLKKETGITFEFEGAIYGDSYKKADLYNDEFKLAIEINPTITHTTQPSPFHGKKVTVKYHQERAILAEQNGWHLIQVFDWDNPDDIASLVKSICNVEQVRVFARKCEVREIPLTQSKEFVKHNHRHGSNASGKISYGLFYNDKLIQVSSFSKERFVKDEGESHYELIRMCSLEGVKVIGGASKLFNAFVNSEYQPQKIKTFADYSKSQGKVYENIGMDFIGLANLNGLYANIDTGEAYKVTACTAKFKSEYEKLGQTQQQYMNSKRFYRINDAGNKIFEWKRSKK